MSKKHKKAGLQTDVSDAKASFHAAEYAAIKHDLWKVVYLNVVYLAALLTVYFTNSRTHYLERLFANLLHF